MQLMSKKTTRKSRKRVDTEIEESKEVQIRLNKNSTPQAQKSSKFIDVLDLDINKLENFDEMNASINSQKYFDDDYGDLTYNKNGYCEHETKNTSNYYEQMDYCKYVRLLGNSIKIDKKTFIDSELNLASVFLSKTKDGSKALQKNIDKFTEEAIKLLFLSIKSEFYNLLEHIYANYFCQILFDKADIEVQASIIKIILSNLDLLLSKNENSLRAIYSILDNDLHPDIQNKIIFYFKKMPDKILCLPQILRILEPIVAYNSVDLSFLKDFIFKKIKILLDIREGYFLLRKFCKELKDPDIQVELVRHLTLIPIDYFKQANACLLSQCILLNFQLIDYNEDCKYNTVSLKDYYKKFYYLEDSDIKNPYLVTVKEEEKLGRRKNANDYFDNKTITKINKVYNKIYTIDKDNKAISLLLQFVLDSIVNLNFSSYEYPSQLVNSSITYGGSMFQKHLIKKIKSNNSFLILLLETKNRGVSLMNNCITQLSVDNLKVMKKIFKRVSEKLDVEKDKNYNLCYSSSNLRDECLDLAYFLQINSKQINSIIDNNESKELIKKVVNTKTKKSKILKSEITTEKVKHKKEPKKSINSAKINTFTPEYFITTKYHNSNDNIINMNMDLISQNVFPNNFPIELNMINTGINYKMQYPYNSYNNTQNSINMIKNVNNLQLQQTYTNQSSNFNTPYKIVMDKNNYFSNPYIPINNVVSLNNNINSNNNIMNMPFNSNFNNGIYNYNMYMETINKPNLLNNSNYISSFTTQRTLNSQQL